ncbi:DUF1877 family protein [Micromonospora sp. NPDC047548]|uniref:DUF1877 family protein n=1 Tax=Micromonospora sp. NPDC047548 TaxID=3155624 RepID=UPI0033C644D3
MSRRDRYASVSEPITDDKWGYDSPRLLTADDVAQTARFLTDTPFASLAQRYAPAELITADIYPAIWDEGRSPSSPVSGRP